MTITHKGIALTLKVEEFTLGGLALELMCAEGPYARVSIWTEETPLLEPNEFVCKNYSENDGIDISLVNAGIAKYTGKTVVAGYTECPILKLTI